ncbi:hypothetical protein ACF07V_31550 [Streptomyces sp. NPDC015661]|uniref:hypothetical protein n=1 Tax=Streptomyces sp. NPDC015661 TaxID=3364961 RepID=UPI0036FF0642
MNTTPTPTPTHYRDQQAGRDLQRFLPERLRLTDATAPEEEFRDWRGHRVHLDRYRNPDAKAKVVLHHGVGTKGRQMSLILGAPLAQRGFETVARDDLGYGLTRVKPGTTPPTTAGATSRRGPPDPHHLSVPVLSRITKVPVHSVMLDNAGHYPLEDPGPRQMEGAVADFVARNTA